jgi:hypothetical protein
VDSRGHALSAEARLVYGVGVCDELGRVVLPVTFVGTDKLYFWQTSSNNLSNSTWVSNSIVEAIFTHTQQIGGPVGTGRVVLHAWHDVVENGCVSYAVTVLVFRGAIRCFDCLCVAGPYTVRY